MDLRRFSAIGEFLARAEGYLLRDEAEHSLVLGLCVDLLHGKSAERPPYLAVVEDGPEVVLAAVRTPAHNLILSRCSALQALDLLLGDLAPSLGALGGVDGPAEVATAFAERWRVATGGRVELEMAQRIYQLDQVTPAVRAEGRLRRIDVADRDLVVDWRVDFRRIFSGGGREEAERAFDAYLQAAPEVRGLHLWEADGRPVSMVGYAGTTPHGVRIGAVYTPPALRGRGYASAAVAALSQWLLDSGRQFCFLHTNLANPTSNHIYQAIGYCPVADATVYRLALG
jgi:predicted GNAT family acetyltransferase